LATTIDNVQIQANSTLDVKSTSTLTMISTPKSTTIFTPTSKGKQNFHDRDIKFFEKMAKTSIGLMKNFERTNELLVIVDHQFDHLINKL